MSKTVSIALAKAHLSECVRDVEHGSSVLITRHGKPVAALVPAEDLEHIERLRKSGPKGGLASLAGGWQNSEELVDFVHQTARTAQRPLPDLE